MTEKQLQKEWERLYLENQRRVGLGDGLKNKNVSLLGELLLIAQAILGKINSGENIVFNEMIYKKTMNFYCLQMKKYLKQKQN